jgi:membrane protein implicated in regulation of membrane protease activity
MKLGRIARLLLLSADELVVGIFLLLILPSLGINVPLAVTVPLLAFLVFKDLLIAPYVLRGGLEKRPEVGPEALVGLKAVAVEDLAPEGIVKVGNELWRGVCVNGNVKRGEKVRVVGFRSNFLLLERPDS